FGHVVRIQLNRVRGFDILADGVGLDRAGVEALLLGEIRHLVERRVVLANPERLLREPEMELRKIRRLAVLLEVAVDEVDPALLLLAMVEEELQRPARLSESATLGRERLVRGRRLDRPRLELRRQVGLVFVGVLFPDRTANPRAERQSDENCSPESEGT